MKTSFSQRTREALAELDIKNKCCKKAFERGKTSAHGQIGADFKCASCAASFMRGLFIAHGSVTDPAKRYHLELSFKDERECDAVHEYMLSEFGEGAPKRTERKSMFILYYKDSAAIEDFLAYIGANKAVFEIMNGKILKEFRNSANRAVNCETANIDKSVATSRRQVKAIAELKAAGEFSKLIPELQRTGELRLEYGEASLAELGLKMEPPISKSGVSHRLSKIMEYYEEYLENKGNKGMKK